MACGAAALVLQQKSARDYSMGLLGQIEDEHAPESEPMRIERASNGWTQPAAQTATPSKRAKHAVVRRALAERQLRSFREPRTRPPRGHCASVVRRPSLEVSVQRRTVTRPAPAGVSSNQAVEMTEEDPRKRSLTAYGLAIGLTLATLLIRLMLDVGWGHRPLLILFMLPIIVSAYWGGFGPGLLATVVAALTVDFFLIPPLHSLRVEEPRDLVQLLIFVAEGIVIGILNEALHRSRRESERRRRREEAAQALLSERERDLAVTLDSIGDAVIATDTQGRVVRMNPVAEMLTGWPAGEAYGRHLSEIFAILNEDTWERLESPVDLVLKEGTVVGLANHALLVARDGSSRAIADSAAAIRDANGSVRGVVLVFRDQSEERKAERALRESEARFRHLAESGIIGIIVSDTLGNIHEANDAFLRMVGYSRQDLRSGALRWADITPPEWREFDEAAIRALETTGVARAREKEYLRKDGSRVPVLVGVAMLAAPRTIAFVLDLTEQRRTEEFRALAKQESTHRERAEAALRTTEEHLRQAQKMEAIGRLAGGVAHDFNNLLSVVLSYSDLLLGDLGAADPMRADVEEIARAGRRATELTRQLLAFSRRQVLQPKVLNPNDTINGMTGMLRRLVGEDIEVVFLPAPAVGQVFVDPGQIEQVLLNLVVNARDAMPHGGRLTIEAANTEIEPSRAAEQLDVGAGSYVLLSVIDTGTGMDSATLARIFEPFFTTKPKGKGTGLGLSTVFGIVKQSGGHIHVESEPGKGTTFRIYLPRTDASPAVIEEARATSRTVQGSETILLVDDDEQVRHVAVAILRRHGYNVLEAATPGDALLICEQFEEPIHLLITDVVMPRMSGRRLWERLGPLRPDMKALFVSGYADDAIVDDGVSSSDLAFLQKPLVPSLLLTKVRSVIDGGGQRG
jgi:two-component system, cell cycle sensor histidine kinase and response regulator CckA